MFKPIPSARPIRRKRRVALGDDTTTRFDGSELDDDRDQDVGDTDILGSLHTLSPAEANSIAHEAIRRVMAEMRDGELPPGEHCDEDELRRLKDELAAKAKSMPSTQLVDELAKWIRLSIRSRKADDHGKSLTDQADSFSRGLAFGGREPIGLSNATKPFPLFT